MKFCKECSYEYIHNPICDHCNKTEENGTHCCKDGLLQFKTEGFTPVPVKMYLKNFKDHNMCQHFCGICIKELIETELISHNFNKCYGCDKYSFGLWGNTIYLVGGHVNNNNVIFCDGSTYRKPLKLKEHSLVPEQSFICDNCIDDYAAINIIKCEDCPYVRKKELTCDKCHNTTKCSLEYEQPGAHYCKDALLKPGILQRKRLYVKTDLIKEKMGSYYCDNCVKCLIESEQVIHDINKCINCTKYAFDINGSHTTYSGGHIYNGQIFFGYGSHHDTMIYDLSDKNQYPNNTFFCDKCVDHFIEHQIIFKRHICSLCKKEDSDSAYGNAFVLDNRYASLSIVQQINNEMFIVKPKMYSMELDSDLQSPENIYGKLIDKSIKEDSEICDECIFSLTIDDKCEKIHCP